MKARAQALACAPLRHPWKAEHGRRLFTLTVTRRALSLCVMLCSLLVALLLGLINSLVKLFGPPWLRLFSTAYTTLVRGIPELVIMLLLFFGGEIAG